MATKASKKNAASTSSSDAESAPKAEWPIEGKTVALAKGKTPPTVDGVINIGMEGSVHVPDEETQRSGFTPYVRRGNKAVDATRLLLQTFPGIYKPVTEKGGGD